jgi:hypothetical protein
LRISVAVPNLDRREGGPNARGISFRRVFGKVLSARTRPNCGGEEASMCRESALYLQKVRIPTKSLA